MNRILKKKKPSHVFLLPTVFVYQVATCCSDYGEERTQSSPESGWSGWRRESNEQGRPSPNPNSSDPCGGFQLASRFMTSFFLPLVCMASLLLQSAAAAAVCHSAEALRSSLNAALQRREAIRWFPQPRLSLVSLPCHVNMPRFSPRYHQISARLSLRHETCAISPAQQSNKQRLFELVAPQRLESLPRLIVRMIPRPPWSCSSVFWLNL